MGLTLTPCLRLAAHRNRFHAASRIRQRCCWLLALIAGAVTSHAQLSWDTNTGTAGAQGGTGNWTGNTFWNNGAANVAWTNGSSAIFGGTVGTVTVNSAVTANALTFSITGYTISGAST